MTIANLHVRLSAETAEFHQQMNRAARRTEQTGRVFVRIGREISTAISLPIIAGAFGAFRALLEESSRSFGPLFQAVESLKAEFHDLFLAIAHELEPTFKQIIGLLRGGIATIRGWVEAFHRLPEGVRKAVIFTLAFLAALGPTLFVVGKLVTAIGALIKILPLVTSPMGLAVAAVAALAAAALYVVTHWEWAKLRLALAWAFIKDLFFEGVRFNILALDILTLGILKIAGVTDILRDKLNELADRSLAKSAAQILELEANLRKAEGPLERMATTSLKIRKILQEWAEATRQLNVQAGLMGVTFNKDAAQAQALEQMINKLVAAGVDLDTVVTKNGQTLKDLGVALENSRERARAFSEALTAFGPTLADQAQAAERFWQIVNRLGGFNTENLVEAVKILTRDGQLMINTSNAIRNGVAGAFEALGHQLGAIFVGTARGFRGFTKAIAGVLGSMLQTVGQALIAFGVAGDRIKKFITNPLAAIAAGVALIALGSALASAAQGAVNAGGSALAGGGGGGSAIEAPASTGTGGGGDVYVSFPGGQVFNPTDPAQQDAFREFLEQLTGRRVIVLGPQT